MTADVSRVHYRPKLLLLAAAAVVLILLALLPLYIGLYQTQLLIYGLIAAIAALGFNLLLGYTGLLSFGHSAFFGIGAYSVAFLLRDAGIHSMELYILIGLPIAAESAGLAEIHQRFHAERRERLFVERLRTLDVAHDERDVVEDRHGQDGTL